MYVWKCLISLWNCSQGICNNACPMGWDGEGWGEKDFHHICLGTFWVFNHLNRFSLSFLYFFIKSLNNKKIHFTSREVKVKVYLFCFLPFCCCSVAKSHLFSTPWTTAHQAPLSSTISQNLLKFMCIESVMLSNHLALCHPFSSCPQSFPASGSFPMSRLFTSGGQSIGASASATILPMNIQSWFPLLSEPFLSVQFSSVVVCECSVMSNSLWPRGLPPTRQEY